MNLFKNTTVYKNRPFLRIERYPYYTQGGKNGHILNKVLFDFKLFKVVTRIKKGNIDKNKIALIEYFTRGKVGTYELKDCLDDNKLENSFLSRAGKYVGNIDKGWWYYKNRFVVHEKYYNTVAIQLKSFDFENFAKNSIKDEFENFITMMFENDNIEGMYGYSHRGGNLFKIGDRLFDETYKPIKKDYPKDIWEKWEKEYKKLYNKADKFDKESIYDSIESIIPFNMRGKKTIETLKDLEQAAKNLGSYLS